MITTCFALWMVRVGEWNEFGYINQRSLKFHYIDELIDSPLSFNISL